MKVQAKYGKVTQIMHGASRNYRYIWDVSGARCVSDLCTEGLVQLIKIWGIAIDWPLVEDNHDVAIWKWSSSGAYSARSAYLLMMEGTTQVAYAGAIWHNWAPL